MSLEINKIHLGDCRKLIKKVPEDFVALSLWSPPYFVGKEYEKNASLDTWKSLLKEVISYHERVLIPGGFMVINIADIKCFKDDDMPRFATNNLSGKKSSVTKEMAIKAKRDNPEYNRRQIAELLGCSEQTVDRRLNGTNIRGGKYAVQTRVRLSGPDIEKFAYDAGLYLYDHRIWQKDAAWANSRWTTNSYKSVDECEDLYVFWKPGETTIDKSRLTKSEWTLWGSRAIWQIPSVLRNDNHPAKFPYELANRIIKLYSQKGDTILDPFMGSGTSALAAKDLERNFIGFEKSEKYYDVSIKQLEKSNIQIKLDY